MLRKAIRLLTDRPQGAYTLRVNPKCRSKMTGNKRSNLITLRELGYEVTIQEDSALSLREILVNI